MATMAKLSFAVATRSFDNGCRHQCIRAGACDTKIYHRSRGSCLTLIVHHLTEPTELAHSLYDLCTDMFEKNTITCISPNKCMSPSGSCRLAVLFVFFCVCFPFFVSLFCMCQRSFDHSSRVVDLDDRQCFTAPSAMR